MKKISRAFVVANNGKPFALQVKKEVQSFLSKRGISRSVSSPQLIITVGGDGTVLFSKKYYGIPFFSIGSKTSFICPANFSDWREKLSRALRDGKLEGRLLLEASVNGKKLPLSLNEIGIRNPEPRLLSMHLVAGSRQHAARKSRTCRAGSSAIRQQSWRRSAGAGEKHFAFRADGVFFSTPTGSMAYCYSCGGKEMKRTAKAYQAVAIAPFRRLFHPTIIPASSACILRVSGVDRAHLFIDGQPAGIFSEKDTLRIRASKKVFLFLEV